MDTVGPTPASSGIFYTEWIEEKNNDEELRPFFSRRNELSAHEGCLLWGSRVVIPEPEREKLLDLLHEGHPGIVRMKNLARSYL